MLSSARDLFFIVIRDFSVNVIRDFGFLMRESYLATTQHDLIMLSSACDFFINVIRQFQL